MMADQGISLTAETKLKRHHDCCIFNNVHCHLLKQALMSMLCARAEPQRCSEGMHLLIAHARRAAATQDESLPWRVLGCHFNAVQIYLHIQSICRRCRAAPGAACQALRFAAICMLFKDGCGATHPAACTQTT